MATASSPSVDASALKDPGVIYFVRYFNYRLSHYDAVQFFARFGTLSRCDMVRKPRGEKVGFLFVEFPEVPQEESALLKVRKVPTADGKSSSRCFVRRGKRKKTPEQIEAAREKKCQQRLRFRKKLKINKRRLGNFLVRFIPADFNEDDEEEEFWERMDDRVWAMDEQEANEVPLGDPTAANKKARKKKRGRHKHYLERQRIAEAKKQAQTDVDEEPEVSENVVEVADVELVSGEDVFGPLFVDQSLHCMFSHLDFISQIRFREVCRFTRLIHDDLLKSLRSVKLHGPWVPLCPVPPREVSLLPPTVTPGVLEKVVERCPALKSLSLTGNMRLPFYFTNILTRKPMSHLTHLQIGALNEAYHRSFITTHGLLDIARSCRNLESLVLYFDIGEKAVTKFLELAQNLRNLELYLPYMYQVNLKFPAMKLETVSLMLRDGGRDTEARYPRHIPFFVRVSKNFPSLRKNAE
ncbi:unnamed protein product [Cyprideis torosa]|uniref:Uncharacterized protein n=1 Tax=Cyprideis torosa TaxID=163714 RepID=A0A7R8ZP52_9CRUS|nr:unnamed protein product [Cyprideis torosa]CAG0887779.1 unnamed protein product [Cyprideis torosa]